MNNKLQKHLTNKGFKSSVISTQHLLDLEKYFADLLEQGHLNKAFYDEIVKRYDLNFQFNISELFPWAKSIIIVAAAQPKVKIKFNLSGKIYPVILPPTYIHDTDIIISNILSDYLNKHNYKFKKTVLPEKPLAVLSGLAGFGRNNIAYITGFGSYFRLQVYFSDIPCDIYKKQELNIMEQCNNCFACIKKCPVSAITKERFLIDASKCITFLNEGEEEFPEWFKSSWHNCLIGCMICQDVCPLNKGQKKWIVEGDSFSDKETNMILSGTAINNLPRNTINKLKKLYLVDDYHLLQRNLSALIKNIYYNNLNAEMK